MVQPPTTPELMAPVADFEMLEAALRAGADAVYLGMPGFNARARTKDFSLEELKEIRRRTALAGVKFYLALNILIFEDELAILVDRLFPILKLNPDALIVQDVGIARLLKCMAPHLPLHASTQMTVASSAAISFYNDLGFSRYNLSREVTIAEMALIRERTDRELEVFVHGALCVAYSGQCLTSESIGGRSANRGQCAQSCRLPWKMVVDGKEISIPQGDYLVSPQDLCGLGDVPRLKTAGINSFKIEGRYKSPSYVATAVSLYRRAIDTEHTEDPSPLQKTFLRGLYNGWYDGVNHQRLVNASINSHSGILLGRVTAIHPASREVQINDNSIAMQAGDGIRFARQGMSLGGSPVYGVRDKDTSRWISLANSFDMRKLKKGDEVFLMSSQALEKSVQQMLASKEARRKTDCVITLSGSPGKPLVAQITDKRGFSARVPSDALLEKPEKNFLSEQFLYDFFSGTGEAPFRLSSLTTEFSEPVFLRHGDLKKLRRDLYNALMEKSLYVKNPPLASRESLLSILPQEKSKSVTQQKPSLHLLIREPEQLAAVSTTEVDSVILDFERGRDYHLAITQARALGVKVGIATTRIHRENEAQNLRLIAELSPDFVLVRNPGAIEKLHNFSGELVGDFSLNIANSLAADYFLQKRLSRITPSYDLNRDQLLKMLANSEAQRFEITLHQYMPEFHMEHCVFAAFLSKGTSFRDCGKPCEKHRVSLRHPNGKLHPLKADIECRNTLFNGTAQSAAFLVPELIKIGVANFRLEALGESPKELHRKIKIYRMLLNGTLAAAQAANQLNLLEQYGLGSGQLYKADRHRPRKKAHPS